MSQPPGSEKIRTACPHCGKVFASAAGNVGKSVRCPACAQPFVITPAEVPARGPAGVAAPADTAPCTAAAGPHCVFCQSPIAEGEAIITCPDCGALLHEDCWRENNGCGMYGCAQAPPTEGFTTLEVPPSYWGREDKPCPRCRKTILAAAVRCRYCGAMFSSATPQGVGAYLAQEKIKAGVPAVRKAGIWLLVFSLIPCTAPFAAFIGLIWYGANRRVIRALPPLNAALCKIAIGVAFAQTGLLVLFGIVAGMAGG